MMRFVMRPEQHSYVTYGLETELEEREREEEEEREAFTKALFVLQPVCSWIFGA